MRKVPIWTWGLVGFFFFAGLGLALWKETSWIGIGQIWMGVAVLLAVVFLGVSGKIGEKLGRGPRSEPRVWSPKPDGIPHRILTKLVEGAATSGAAETADATAGTDTAERLQRLERLRAGGDLTEDEYRTQRDRIISGA